MRWRTLAASTLCALACACAGAEEPRARDGRLDATEALARGQIVPLDGDWQFVPGLVAPTAAWPAGSRLVTVPGAWNDTLGSRHGSGTYRLQVACDSRVPLTLALPFEHTALAFHANGVLVASQGRPGADADAHEPRVAQQFARLEGASCPIELRVQVSNFELYRGGLMRSVQLGPADAVAQRREFAILRSSVALGVTGVMALFALMFFVARPRGRSALWLALFCASTAWGVGTTGDRVLQPLLEGLSFAWQMRLLFFNWFTGLLLYPVLVASLYPRQANRNILGLLTGFAGAGAVLTLVTPVGIFAYSGPLLQFAAPAAAGYSIWVLVRALLARERGAAVVLAGLGGLIAAVMHDLVFYQHLLSASATPYGMIGVVLAPAALLAQRLGRALGAEELRAIEQRERADLLVRATQAGVLDWDAPSGVVKASDRYREMLGLPSGEDAPQQPPFETLVHPDDRERVMAAFMGHLRDRRGGGLRRWEPMEYRMLHASGDVVWVHAEAISVCGDDGRTLRYICTFIDITHLKATEQALATERERLRLLVRSTKAGFGDWDAVRDVVTYTDRFKAMLGYPADHDTSTWPSIFEMMHPDDRERAHEQFRAMIRRKPQGGEQEPGEPMSYRLRRADGEYIWIHAEGISQVDAEGRTRRFITSYLDVTRFHEQEEQLRRSRDQVAAQAELLERQNEALKENVRLREEVERIGRHDLKTPLNSIVAVPRLLREERRLGPEADELLGVVERAGYRILSMVNLSLDLYKMEQGSYTFRPDAVDLADLAHKVIADVRMHAASKQVRIELQAWQAPYAWAEELLCYSLLANLLKNAVEASPEGSTVRLRIDPAGDSSVCVRIHNLGAVPEAIRSRFFSKYTTLGKASGTGLGAYSAWLMAKVQDGEVAMETSDEAGTTLTVTLRAAPAGQVPAALRHAVERSAGAGASALAALPPTRVLLVDDDEYNLLIVRRFLPTPPFTVDTAINGRVALSCAELQWPDVVFMDLDMPVMGGLEAVGKLRELQRRLLAKPCTVVALSSHEDAETRDRALAAGFDEYLTKPVNREIVHAVLLDQHMQIGESGVGPRPPADAAAVRAQDPVHVDAEVEPILAEFLASRRELLAQLGAAADGGERGEVRRIAHLLAGSFALYGFGWASERSRWLEGHFSEVPPDGVHALRAELLHHLDTVEVRFRAADIG